MAETPTTMPTPANLWDQIIALTNLKELPTREEFVQALLNIGTLQAVFLVAIGLVYLMYGWRAFKALVIINAAILGAIVGAMLGGLINGTSIQGIFAVAGALLFAALSWPLMKHAVGLMGALAGSLIGFSVWRWAANLSTSETLGSYAWAGALIGLIALGLLAFVIFQGTIIIFTSLQGSLMVVSGILSVLLKADSIRTSLSTKLITNTNILPVLIVVPAIIGLVFQYVGSSKKSKKKAKPGPS